jgi:transposase
VRGEPAARRDPGIGPVVATALVAETGDWKEFASGRSWLRGLGWSRSRTRPAGKDKLGSITKQGNRYLRSLLVTGAMAVIRYAQKAWHTEAALVGRLTVRRPIKVAAAALAIKIARMACPSSFTTIEAEPHAG